MKMNAGAWIGLIGGLLGAIIGIGASISADPSTGLFVTMIIVGVFLLIYWVFFRPMITRNRIIKTGEQRNGKILEVWDTGVTINNSPQVGLLVEVKDKYGKTYQTKTKLVVSRLQVGDIKPGLSVVVRVDPKNEQKIAIESFGSMEAGGANSVSMDELQKSLQKILELVDNENKEIMLSGISAEAKVISYYDLNVKVNGDNPFVMLFIEVHPGLKEPFYADVKGVIGVQAISKFQPGEMITVKYDPNNLRRVTVEHS